MSEQQPRTQPDWFSAEPALGRLLQRQLGQAAYARALPRLTEMGRRAAGDVARWAQEADWHGPRLVTHDREGRRIDEIAYHPSYRRLQEVAYGGGIVAATYDPELAPEHGGAPHALTFGLGYVFGQAESGLYCPVCMTDGAARLVQRYGTPQLVDRFVPRLAARDMARLYTGAMFLTEKEGGSDVGQVRTVARREGDHWRLHGEKWFCSNVDADVIMILARPEGAGAGTRGLGLFLLPRTLEDGTRNRFRIDRIKDKLGVRSMPTGEVTLEGAEAYLLGAPGEGFHQMTEMLNLSRLYNAVASVGVMRRAVTEAWAWADQRVTFGRRLAEHPLMAEVLLDLASEQRAALTWSFRCIELLDRKDAGTATEQELLALRLCTPLLKYHTAKRCVWAASEGVEALGGNGYIEDWPMARVLRDAQVLPIWEGATNVLVLDAFRAIKKEGAHQGLFAELARLVPLAPHDIQARLAPAVDELTAALGELAQDPAGEHALRDWTDRAAVLWQVALLGAAGHPGDVRAARRLLARHVDRALLRRDRASEADVRLVAFG